MKRSDWKIHSQKCLFSCAEPVEVSFFWGKQPSLRVQEIKKGHREIGFLIG